MDLILYRQDYTQEGVFGVMGDFQTLEHAYPGNPIGWVAKVDPGTYWCVLGAHRLESMKEDFQTYRLQVEGHTDILFHPGNTNADSNGCILLGTRRSGNMILNSKQAFDAFMKLQDGVDSFQLTVI